MPAARKQFRVQLNLPLSWRSLQKSCWDVGYRGQHMFVLCIELNRSYSTCEMQYRCMPSSRALQLPVQCQRASPECTACVVCCMHLFGTCGKWLHALEAPTMPVCSAWHSSSDQHLAQCYSVQQAVNGFSMHVSSGGSASMNAAPNLCPTNLR